MAEVRNTTTTTTTTTSSDFNHISPSALNGNGIGSSNTSNTHLAVTAARNAQLNNSNSMNSHFMSAVNSHTTTTTTLLSSSSTHHQLPQNMRVNNPLLASTSAPTVTTSNTNSTTSMPMSIDHSTSISPTNNNNNMNIHSSSNSTSSSPPSTTTNTTTFPTTSTLGVPNPIFNANNSNNSSSGIQISPVIVNGTSPINMSSSSTKAYDANHPNSNNINNMNMNNRPRAQSMSALHPTNQAQVQGGGVQQHGVSSSSSSSQKDRRMKRLERNRESARVSRRRRKQYLEVLEERVVSLSRDMDVGRCQHVQKSIPTITHLRYKTIEAMMKVYRNTTNNNTNTKTQASGSVVVKKEQQQQQLKIKQQHDQLELLENTLETYLSRTSDELRLCTIFQREQLSSMVLAPHQRFILWLTLQNDIFFLGGRGASERLSAARIGERMLSSGNDRSPPSNGMWPLLCNEITLSYDQEEKVRIFQRTKCLSKPESWLDSRHNGVASSKVISEISSQMLNLSETVKQREKMSTLRVLTLEQKVKLRVWLMKKIMMHKQQQQQEQQQTSPSQQKKGVNWGAITNLIINKTKRMNPNSTNNTNSNNKNNNNNEKKVKIKVEQGMEPEEEKTSEDHEQMTTSPNYHSAANLYITYKILQQNQKLIPGVAPPLIKNRFMMNHSQQQYYKKLSRRPSFESLGASTNNNGDSSGNLKGSLSRNSSSNSLKRSAANMSSGTLSNMVTSSSDTNSTSETSGGSTNGNNVVGINNHNITPEQAQNASDTIVENALKVAGVLLPPRQRSFHHSQHYSTYNNNNNNNGNGNMNNNNSNSVQQQNMNNGTGFAFGGGMIQNTIPNPNNNNNMTGATITTTASTTTPLTYQQQTHHHQQHQQQQFVHSGQMQNQTEHSQTTFWSQQQQPQPQQQPSIPISMNLNNNVVGQQKTPVVTINTNNINTNESQQQQQHEEHVIPSILESNIGMMNIVPEEASTTMGNAADEDITMSMLQEYFKDDGHTNDMGIMSPAVMMGGTEGAGEEMKDHMVDDDSNDWAIGGEF